MASKTIINFEGLDIYDVFVALRARARARRGDWVDFYERSRPHISNEEIDTLIRDRRGNLTYVDRIDGGAVVLKTNFASFPNLDSYCYNRFEDNGFGAMESVRDFLLRRKEGEAGSAPTEEVVHASQSEV